MHRDLRSQQKACAVWREVYHLFCKYCACEQESVPVQTQGPVGNSLFDNRTFAPFSCRVLTVETSREWLARQADRPTRYFAIGRAWQTFTKWQGDKLCRVVLLLRSDFCGLILFDFLRGKSGR